MNPVDLFEAMPAPERERMLRATVRELHDKHDEWCGYKSNSPGSGVLSRVRQILGEKNPVASAQHAPSRNLPT